MTSGKYKAVAVSNTFTMKWEMQPYIDLAKSLGWALQVIRTTGKYKSIHGVPQDSIDRMQSRFEPFAGEVIK
jgi:sensor domain CHASE-containing protein